MDEETAPDRLYQALEALLIVAPESVSATDLASALEVPEYLVTEALEELRAEYAGETGLRPRGFELRHLGGKWRFYSVATWAPFIESFVVGSSTPRLSQAALETLAIIAYRQPMSRTQIANIRGVNSDSVIRNLVSRGLIEETGQSPTGAALYGTTGYFLECMGFETLDELIPLAPLLPSAEQIAQLTIEVED